MSSCIGQVLELGKIVTPNEYAASLWDGENVLEINCVWLYNSVITLLTIELHILRNMSYVNYILISIFLKEDNCRIQL